MRAKIMKSKTHTNFAILGNIGHGMTTLTRAITKELKLRKMSDKTPKKRGAMYSTIRYVDCSEMADSNQIINLSKLIDLLSQVDGIILVVSATDGLMPQTREHILLARQIGVPYIVVFINKVDQVEHPKLLNLLEEQIRDLLSNYYFPGDDTPIIKGSALKVLKSKLQDPNAPDYDCINELIDKLNK